MKRKRKDTAGEGRESTTPTFEVLESLVREQAQPWVGASWEGYVIEQTLGELAVLGRVCDAYYFRTSDQHEVDLVLELGGELWAVEVKLTTSPGPEDLRRLDKVADLSLAGPFPAL